MTASKIKDCCSLLTLFLLLGTVGTLLVSKQAGAVEIPQLKSRVNDYAAMLSPATRQQLENILTNLEQEESTQVAVLTINSLNGANLEEFSLQVVEKWKLGQKGLDNGALLLIAKNDRKLRIEVGYGLEGVLTDLTCGRIIRDIITPQFRNGNFNQGVIAGVSAMIAAVRGEFDGQEVTNSSQKSSDDIAGFLVFLLVSLFNISTILRKKKLLATAIGAIVAPLIGSFFSFPWIVLLILIPVGALACFLASLILGNASRSSTRRRGGFRNHSSGGFGGGGFSGGGGFGGGGGGGFGGGGSSGGW